VAELRVAELSGERLPQCGIERELPGAGKTTPEQLKAVSLISCGVLRQLRPEIRWVHSYVSDDKMNCAYLAIALDYFLNRPNPTRTCTVLIPGFGVVKPALEMCR
jgi:hypothetical protein